VNRLQGSVQDQEKEGIADDEERLLWSKDLLGDKTAQS